MGFIDKQAEALVLLGLSSTLLKHHNRVRLEAVRSGKMILQQEHKDIIDSLNGAAKHFVVLPVPEL